MKAPQTTSLFGDLPVIEPTTVIAEVPAPQEKKEIVYSVGEFLDVINAKLKGLSLTIQGEIGKVDYRGGAVYFTLNDKKEKATLGCIVWRSRLTSMGIELREGLEVKVVGAPNIYKPMGKFSFEAQYISPVGEGALKLAFEKLKKDLEAKGYFEVARKRAIPAYPQHIGLITSASGEAQRDFITHLGNYGFKIYFYDVRVEGVKSIPSVVAAITWFNQHNINLDVLVLTRGGGSMESLQAFNSEDVAKAIFGSRIPVISAIGHERDVTIADHVADQRASTPTDAGKLLSRQWSLAAQTIDGYDRAISTVFRTSCARLRYSLATYESSWLNGYARTIAAYIARLTHIEGSLITTFKHLIQDIRFIEQAFSRNYERLRSRIDTLQKDINTSSVSLIYHAECYHAYLTKYLGYLSTTITMSDPELKLKQGYSIAKKTDGTVLKDPASVSGGDIITVQLYKGSLKSTVID